MAYTDKLPGQHCGWCRRALGVESEQTGPQGATLVLAAVGVFLVPLVLALIGVLAFSAWGTLGSVLGGAGGFALGLVAAAGVRRLTTSSGHQGQNANRSSCDDEVQR